MRHVIEEVRAKIGAVPRKFGFFERRFLSCPIPGWMNASDKLHEFFRNRNLLLTKGTVVWRALVQTNALLFKPGKENHPAMVVYSPDPAMLGDLDGLVSVATQLYNLKGTAPKDPDQARFAAMITDEMDRGLGWTIPVALTGGKLRFSRKFAANFCCPLATQFSTG